MRAGQRPWFWIGIVLFGGTTAVLCYRFWPHERLLLDRTTRINLPRDPEDGSSQYEWVSDHAVEQTRFDWHPQGSTRATVIQYDLASGTTARFPVCRYPGTSHARLECSPDGRWVLTWEGTGPEAGEKVTATELSTGRSLSWPSLGDTYHCTNFWLPDGKRWLQYTTLPDGYITLYSLEPAERAVRLQVPDNERARWKNAVPIGDHLGIMDFNGWENTRDRLVFREYRLTPTMTLLRHLYVSSPGGKKIVATEFSPDGTRIAWMCSESYVSPLILFLHRWLPRLATKSEERYSLWISNLDGSHAYEVGHMPAPVYDLDTPSEGLHLRWLPGGKRLWFMYQRHLYTVTAE